MWSERKRRLVGAGLVVVGLLLLMVTNHILIGWEHVWPLFLMLAGVLMLRVFRTGRDPIVLFAALSTVLLGFFLLLFSVGALEWTRMSTLWPVIPLIAGASLLVSAFFGRHGNTAVLVGIGVVLFAVVGLMVEGGAISRRVAGPVIRLWPLVLVIAGVVVFRSSVPISRPTPVAADPDMEAVRAVMSDPVEESAPSEDPAPAESEPSPEKPTRP